MCVLNTCPMRVSYLWHCNWGSICPLVLLMIVCFCVKNFFSWKKSHLDFVQNLSQNGLVRCGSNTKYGNFLKARLYFSLFIGDTLNNKLGDHFWNLLKWFWFSHYDVAFSQGGSKIKYTYNLNNGYLSAYKHHNNCTAE